ncbi:MAG: hypothetical protein WCW03_02020 [Candidatus Paceibacterota bacterium]|jgi:hypothetical protein
MEFFKLFKVPDDLVKPETQEEIDSDYIDRKTRQSRNIIEQSFEDKTILVAIEDLSTPIYGIKEGFNQFSFGNEKDTLQISFFCEKLDIYSLSTNQTLAFFNLEQSFKQDGIKERTFHISNLKIKIGNEELDLKPSEDQEYFIISPLINSGISSKDRFKRMLLSRTNPDSGIIYSGLPIDNILAIFNLFHEIGHLKYMAKLDIERKEELKESRKKEQKTRKVSDTANILEEERMASKFALDNVRRITKFFKIDQRYLSKIVHLYLTSYSDS